MSWVLPALKAILPHVGTIIEAAKPVFHRRSVGEGRPTVEEQIAELQAATTDRAPNPIQPSFFMGADSSLRACCAE